MTGWWSDVFWSVWMDAEVGAKNCEAAGESKIWSSRLLLALYWVGYRVKVPEGIDEAWGVARDLPAEPWPLVVRLEVPSVQLRAHYAVGVSA